MVTVSLPIPDRCLSPNARAHWAVRSKAAKRQHAVAFFQTIEADSGTNPKCDFKSAEPIGVRCRWFCRDRRRRDTDNLLASMKHAFDGIAEALGVDDRHFVHWPADIGYDRDRPRVEVDLWPIGSEGQGAIACQPSPSSEPIRPS